MAFGIGFPFGMQGTGGVGGDIISTPGIDAPNFTGTLALIDAPVGTTYNVNIAALNTGGSIATYSLNGTLPSGLALNTSTGSIVGTTTTAATYSGYSVNGTNASGTDTTNTDSVIISGASGDTVDASFRIARNTTTSVNQNAAFTVLIDANVTSGPAPLAVNLDGFINSTFTGISDPENELSFWWDFGDAGAVFENIPADHPFGKDATTAMGDTTGHVYESEGSYTIKLYVYDHVTGDVGYAESAISVSNADTFYAGTKTVCLDTSGVFAGAPTGSNNQTTWSGFATAIKATGDHRGLIRYGEDVDADLQVDNRNDGIYRYGAFGNPANGLPIVRQVLGGYLIYVRIYGNLLITEWDVRGDYNPVDGTGETYKDEFLFAYGGDNIALWRNKVAGLNMAFNAGETAPASKNFVIQDNLITDFYDHGVFGHLNNTTVRGNSIKQNLSATDGGGGKKSSASCIGFTETGDGVKVAFAHGFDMDGNTGKNLFVAKRVLATGVITEMVLTTDYTTTNPADGNTSGVVTYVVAPLATEEVYIYYRRWADHGPIRTARAHPCAITHNDMLTRTGWFVDGSIQPTIRYNSTGDIGHRGNINMNRCVGGNQVIHAGPSDDANDSFLGNVKIESNYVEADGSTWRFISTQFGNSIIRNNVLRKYDQANTDGRVSLEGAFDTGVGPLSSAANTAGKVRIYNNTIINEHSATYSAVNMVVTTQNATSDTVMTDVVESNNLVYAPSLPTPNTTNTPIDLGNYGAVQAGNPAIDNGSNLQQLVWDDFFGSTRGVVNSLGASDQPQALTAPTMGTIAFTTATEGVAYSYQIPLTGGTATSINVVTGAMGNGLSVSTTGLISGTPVDGTDLTGLSFSATNAIGTSSTSNVDTLVVDAAVLLVPVLSGTFNIADGTVGDVLNQDVSSLETGGGAATGWAFTGTPPTGLSISSVGVITGTLVEQTLAGNSYGVKATNATGDSNILLDADGITVSAAAALELDFDAVDTYLTIPPTALVVGDLISFKFKATGNLSYASLIGGPPAMRFYVVSQIRWATWLDTVTLDGTAITSNTVQSEVEDGLEHTIVARVANNYTYEYFGSYNGSSEFYNGVLKDLSIDRTANGGGVTTWAINSGVTGVTATESPVVDANSIGDITIHNAASGDWS